MRPRLLRHTSSQPPSHSAPPPPETCRPPSSRASSPASSTAHPLPTRVASYIWQPRERGLPMVIYGITLAGGPALAPVIEGALCSSESHTGWRWTEYLTLIVMVVQLAVDVLFLDESYAPRLLASKARRLLEETGNFALHAVVSSMSMYSCVCTPANTANASSTRNVVLQRRNCCVITFSGRSRCCPRRFAC